MKITTASFMLLCGAAAAHADTTIDAANKFAWGANIGWLNFAGDTTHGAVSGEYVCSGSIYSANVGWISLGSGAPANGIYYQNNAANDYGVNQDGQGNLRGYAYGANIGWVNFEATGAPTVNLLTGSLSGCVWSANCGWISLSNAIANVQTDSIRQGALAADGLPVAWLLSNFGTTNVDANADPDGDGMSNAQEYLAGTDPNSARSALQITSSAFRHGGTNASVTWTSVPTRYYYVQETTDLSSGIWQDSGLGLIAPSGNFTTADFNGASAPDRFYRVQAVCPLTP